MPKYAVFTTKINVFGDFHVSCCLAKIDIAWHIFVFVSSTKVVKQEKIFDFTTRKIRLFLSLLSQVPFEKIATATF